VTDGSQEQSAAEHDLIDTGFAVATAAGCWRTCRHELRNTRWTNASAAST
jgi:hypothetical protein